ncbi:MAG: transcription-repair coupling factor [Anaerolineae bacterium]|nr:transcription-repair coupling factor [Anaerolineae bacterium]MDH7472522.1 transcription-repair coupling factor [Anaerolineae bacterium]
MNLSGLLSLLNEIPAYRELLQVLNEGRARGADQLWSSASAPLGLLRAARPCLIAALQRDLARPIVVVTGRTEQAAQLHGQLRFWLDQPEMALRFTEPDALPYERIPWAAETIRERLMALVALTTARQPVIVASARALMQKTIPVRQFRLGIQTLHQGQVVSLEKTLARWVALGYEPVSVVEEPGTFSRRGGIVDVFPPASPLPVRVEFFGDEIDSLRLFDPATQRSRERISGFTLTPACEALPRHGPQATERLAALDIGNLHAPAAAEFRSDCQALTDGRRFKGIEFYLPYLYAQPGSLMDFLPADGLLLVDDWAELEAAVAELEEQAVTMCHDLISAGELSPDFAIPYFTWDELREILEERHPLTLGYDDLEPALTHPLSQVFVSGPRYGGQLRRVLEELHKMRTAGRRVIVVSRQAQRLATLWSEQRDPIRPQEDIRQPPPARSLIVVQGTLAEGFLLREKGEDSPVYCTLLTDAEIFGWSRPEPRRMRRRPVSPETFFADIEPGDYVVHVEHGIGIFRGLIRLTIEGAEREYLQVDYAGADKLYVPIHHSDRLSRYVGTSDRPPALSRLGTAEWAQVKARAKRAVEDIARDLLALYSAREVVPGHAFSPDTPWQAELEAAFPYVETEDQLKAIEQVKADMEKPRPMDRLICGDVGYGKTEVALRAAFKAVMDGKQVAVLVPTTVLAQQHYETFRQRLKPFPVEVEMLSRFRSQREQRDILERLKAGQVDIVIGTHRLLSRDVVFKDLGLLIIDEEQRFGVTHKERLKQMRTEVDVLTMTATPIPRTLYMSLTGVRDMSTIDTPPEERLPIRTHVGQFDKSLIRKAILRELDRGGQVFFVHNRVQGIHQMAQRLQRLVPEAKLAIAHGQMDEAELERVMLDFAAGKTDVLVCTSIIESGLDIPNANTIIINRADQFGLAQLYQLRGRVGRGAVRAYAYLLYGDPRRLTETARQRLETIMEASELGAGFSLAMRDLEIRGAGDILGTRQHGHIAAIGFDLYTRLLAQAVRELKGEAAEQTGEVSAFLQPLTPGVQITLPLDAYLPEEYVPDPDLRLRLYRRLGGVTSMEQVDELERELVDRFGPLPVAAANLLYQLRLKVLALRVGVQSIGMENHRLVLKAEGLERVDRQALQRQLGQRAHVERRRVWLPLPENETLWRTELVWVLEKMVGQA